MDIKPNSGPIFVTNFYGYGELKKSVLLISQPVKAENTYKAYVFASVLTSLVLM